MYEQVRTQFNSLSSEYDAHRRKLIPAFDAFYDAGVEFLAFGQSAPAVLDVGAGTGIFTERLLKRYPNAVVTLLDFSENMLDLAREKFARNPNISFAPGDFSDADIGKSQYDIVISALALHHLDEEGKRAFYARLHTALRERGEFVNADIIEHESPELTARCDGLWTDFVRSNIGDGEFFDRFLASKNVDKPSTVDDQLAWLRACGFERAYSLFEYLNFAVIYSRK